MAPLVYAIHVSISCDSGWSILPGGCIPPVPIPSIVAGDDDQLPDGQIKLPDGQIITPHMWKFALLYGNLIYHVYHMNDTPVENHHSTMD